MTSSYTTLGHDHAAFVKAEVTDNVQGLGVVHPRVSFELRLETNSERVQAEIHYLRLIVKFAGEVIGEGTAHGDFVDSHDRRLRVEVPMTRTALGFISENLQADRLDLTLSLQGWMRIKYDVEDGRTAYNHPPGEWWFTTFGMNGVSDINLQIARSDWFKGVLEPLGSYEYVLTEVPVLKGRMATEIQSSLRQIKEAERLFAEGNDAAVFQSCKGMIEALPGWPKGIFGGLVDKNKAEYLDGLTLAASQYYNHGRHIAQEGTQEGDFPINHREALFALNMAKTLLAEIAAVLGGA